MNLEERVVAAEVASRRADGPGVIEVQSQRRSDVAGQGLGPGTQWSGRPVRPGSRGVRRPGADHPSFASSYALGASCNLTGCDRAGSTELGSTAWFHRSCRNFGPWYENSIYIVPGRTQSVQ